MSQRWGGKSYAQHGDDYMIVNIFEMLGVEKPSYLDIGAHHPTEISNTALLYERGCRGINVEPNPLLYGLFQRMRPEDKNINVGVGTTTGTFDLLMFDETSGLNTFCQEEADKLKDRTVNRRMKLPVITLPDLVLNHCDRKFPNLLSIDIEGWDYGVLGMLPPNAKWPPMNLPDLIVVETRRHDTQRMVEMLKRKRFDPYCRMGENLFFVREDLIEKLY